MAWHTQCRGSLKPGSSTGDNLKSPSIWGIERTWGRVIGQLRSDHTEKKYIIPIISIIYFVLIIGRLVSFKFGNVSQWDSILSPVYWPLVKDTDPISPLRFIALLSAISLRPQWSQGQQFMWLEDINFTEDFGFYQLSWGSWLKRQRWGWNNSIVVV